MRYRTIAKPLLGRIKHRNTRAYTPALSGIRTHGHIIRAVQCLTCFCAVQCLYCKK